jgi:phosphoadenosine phosphosulfate reductase
VDAAPICRDEPVLQDNPVLQSEDNPIAVPRQGILLLRDAILSRYPGRIAVVSSFGAESAVLLAHVAEIDPAVPVLFLDTQKHFPETLDYCRTLSAHLGLRDVRLIAPDGAELALADPDGTLHRYVPDDCCALRKVAPLTRALAPFAAWINGRKRHQAATRAGLAFVEQDEKWVKFNPLADWSAADIAAEMTRRDLPRHPLALRGYTSIGCAPCTQPAGAGGDIRAGRWAGTAKVECGIHSNRANAPKTPLHKQIAMEADDRMTDLDNWKARVSSSCVRPTGG